MSKFTGKTVSEHSVYSYIIDDEVVAVNKMNWDYIWMNSLALWVGTKRADDIPLNKDFVIVSKVKKEKT